MTDEQVGELISKITEINYRLTDENFLKSLSGDVLSYLGVKLSAMKASLIEYKVSAHADMLRKEVEAQRIKGEAFLRAKEKYGSTAAVDAKYADEEFVKAQMAFADAKALYEKMRTIATDTHDTIESIKTRVIDLQGARKDERLG